jgi:hypothetical protein
MEATPGAILRDQLPGKQPASMPVSDSTFKMVVEEVTVRDIDVSIISAMHLGR